MQTKQNQTDADHREFGLVAMGTSQTWEVSVDESLNGPRTWHLTLDGPLLYLCVEIESPNFVRSVLTFLERSGSDANAKAGFLCLGKSAEAAVSIILDDEYAERCFIITEGIECCVLRLTIADNDFGNLMDALRDLTSSLEEELVS